MSDGEMTERVARALFVAEQPKGESFNDFRWEHTAANYRLLARAALQAMREPTERMVDAVDVEGGVDAGGTNNATYYVGAAEAKQVWHQMLDEALK